MNNLGCYYKRTGKPNVAMKYLNKALNLEKKHQIGNVSETYVNMCAIYSAMGKHDVALQYALEALDNFQKQAHENYTSLAIVYNNIGIEYEYLKRFR